jgi:hypothetical protein
MPVLGESDRNIMSQRQTAFKNRYGAFQTPFFAIFACYCYSTVGFGLTRVFEKRRLSGK